MSNSIYLLILGPAVLASSLVAQETASETDPRTERAIQKLKADVCVQLERLLKFKDKSDFKKFGFGRGGPYYRWLEAVETLRDAQPKGLDQPIPLVLRIAPGDLMMLGMEYMQKQKETDYTREILPELKQTIGYADYLAKKRTAAQRRSLQLLRTWTDKTGNYKVNAKCIAYSAGRVTLKKANGDEVVVPLNKLSDKDRSLVESAYPKAAEQTDAVEP